MFAVRAKPGRAIFLAVVLVGLAFATFTEHAWEDYWITFRASRNLATGHGLVFTVGDRLQTFTSPLGVLLPAGLSWLTGNQNDDLVLWLFRLVSIAALAAAIVLLFHVLICVQKHRASTVLTLALLALDTKTVDFTINGMETGLVIFFLALTLHGFLVGGPRQALRLGLGWAGLMWSRPDSFVYIGLDSHLAGHFGGLGFFMRSAGHDPNGCRAQRAATGEPENGPWAQSTIRQIRLAFAADPSHKLQASGKSHLRAAGSFQFQPVTRVREAALVKRHEIPVLSLAWAG